MLGLLLALGGIVMILGSLAVSMVTNDSRWFLIGYPVAFLMMLGARRVRQ